VDMGYRFKHLGGQVPIGMGICCLTTTPSTTHQHRDGHMLPDNNTRYHTSNIRKGYTNNTPTC
jgi:hypothetical protein